MEQILKKITDRIKQDEENRFLEFKINTASLAKRKKPIDIISLLKRRFFLIAEIKKKSPSKGVIRPDFDPVKISRAYEKGGASAISVITEKNFFCGAKKYLSTIKDNTGLPVLRKDFIIHPFQIFESYNLGADFLLLIVACLTNQELLELYRLTLKLDMQALIEVHNEKELERAMQLEPKIIGINNRDLRTFQVDTQTSYRLKQHIPEGVFVISESGLRTHEDIVQLKKNNFDGALIGESLLRETDVQVALERMIHG